MTYPYGMKYSRLAFSQPLTVSGQEADSTKITIVPTHRVIWRDSGRPLDAFTETVQALKGQPGSVTAPYVDQPGFRDDAGEQVTGWSYTVVRTAVFEGQTQTVEKIWTPLIGQEAVDFDLLPSTAKPGVPTTIQAPEVISVAGATGAVSTDYLAERLEPWMDAKMAEYETADGIIPAVAAGIMTPNSDVQEAVDSRAKRAADAAAASKLDKTAAASTYATKTAVEVKLDKTAAAGTYATKDSLDGVKAVASDAGVAGLIAGGAQTSAALTASINKQVDPRVEQVAADYLASDRTVADAAAAAVNANPKIAQIETVTIPAAQNAAILASLGPKVISYDAATGRPHWDASTGTHRVFVNYEGRPYAALTPDITATTPSGRPALDF